MTTLVSALDHHTPAQYGENGHKEYGWSHDTQELILQLSFQLTRTKDPQILTEKYRELLYRVFNTPTPQRNEYLSILYRMMLQTRDVVAGKGEYGLFYVLLGEWVRFAHSNNNELAHNLSFAALKSLVELDNFPHAYGSWKDFKYFLKHLHDNVATETQKKECTTWPIFKYAIEVMILQLRKDAELANSNQPGVTLLAKWLPREKSKKFGWIGRLIACEYFKEWIQESTHNSQAVKKCVTHYRILIANINKHLKTVQINQCNKTWRYIDFGKSATSITIALQKRAFQYVNKRGVVRGTDEDRLACKKNFEEYVESCKTGEKTMKGGRVGINDLIKEALQIISHKGGSPQGTDVDTLNLQWKEQGKQIGQLDNFIAMVDTSGSMECDGGNPLYAAIGLGCRVAEKSKLGKRVLTFSASPTWVNLEPYPELIDMVSVLKRSAWGMNTNFVSALKLIIDACIERDLAPDEVKDLALVVFSDMQIDVADNNSNSMYETIQQMFREGGMRTSHRKPYTPAHIVFWNLRSTGGSPSLSSTKNVSMLSGFSPALLNGFCEKGISALEDYSPWKMFIDGLEHERYAWAKTITLV
jgi:hypothetical protein